MSISSATAVVNSPMYWRKPPSLETETTGRPANRQVKSECESEIRFHIMYLSAFVTWRFRIIDANGHGRVSHAKGPTSGSP